MRSALPKRRPPRQLPPRPLQRPRSAAGLPDSSQDFPGHLQASRALADLVGACRAAPQQLPFCPSSVARSEPLEADSRLFRLPLLRRRQAVVAALDEVAELSPCLLLLLPSFLGDWRLRLQWAASPERHWVALLWALLD